VSLGPAEILVILVIALLVFGPNRLPEIGRQVGRGMREIRKFQASLKSDLDDVLGDDSKGIKPAPELPPKAAPSPVEQSDDAESTDMSDTPPPPPPPDPT
jgi:sec-independent protein translocase protein TatA